MEYWRFFSVLWSILWSNNISYLFYGLSLMEYGRFQSVLVTLIYKILVFSCLFYMDNPEWSMDVSGPFRLH